MSSTKLTRQSVFDAPRFRRADPAPGFVDLFAGCGGLSLGLEMAGWRPLMVSEISNEARQTYLANRLSKHPDLADFSFPDVNDLMSETALQELSRRFRNHYKIKDIDAVVGGPPCQGYSGIGYRRTFSDLNRFDIPSNHLFKKMVFVIEHLRPKIFLFENVRGIMSGRWTAEGERGEIWADVKSAFEAIPGYFVDFKVLYAKQFGVPQNRPRVFLVGIREDQGFEPDPLLPAHGLLPSVSFRPPGLRELLSDLIHEPLPSSLVTEAYPSDSENPVQEWFRRTLDGRLMLKGEPVSDHEYSNHSGEIRKKFKYMLDNDGRMKTRHITKKFAQKVLPEEWDSRGPTITATSMTDDYVHFEQPRTLTVREWARLQTFPDWYQFKGKRTTGGRRRAGDPLTGVWERDLPKYTQIGNAVPVLVARTIGEHFLQLITENKRE